MSKTWLCMLGCITLLTIFYCLANLGISGRCATFDEPLHFIAGWERYHNDDFRMDVEDPPLWQYWAVLGSNKSAMKFDYTRPTWRWIPQAYHLNVAWAREAMYANVSSDMDAVFQPARMRMLLLGVAVGVLIGVWAWQLAGRWAALLAMALFCFDPNFLAHAPLMKDDVVFALLWCGLAMALWRVGRCGRWLNILALVVLPGLAMCNKYSGLLAFPVLALGLLIRCFLGQSWTVLGWNLSGLRGKMVASSVIFVTALIVAWGGVWASYRFHYIPMPATKISLAERDFVLLDAQWRYTTKNHHTATTRELEETPQDLPMRLILWANHKKLLPQAFCYGLIYTRASVVSRSAFLCGQRSTEGWWYYFPVAMLFKTPLATLAIGVMGIPVIVVLLMRKHVNTSTQWSAICLLFPVVFYMASAMCSHLNIGLRHILPLYPLLYVAAAWGMVRLMHQWPTRLAIAVSIFLVAGLVAETLAAYPNFIPFFNAACGGSRGGIHLLGDSNLDWGQDLTALASWQKQHSEPTLYLSYFGQAIPDYYGIQYVDADLATDEQIERSPGILAISASNLQGMYLDEKLRARYMQLLKREPMAILGGSIYLFPWPVWAEAAH